MKIYSHPPGKNSQGKLLKDHLEETSNYCDEYGVEYEVDNLTTSEISSIIAAVHDFGKMTTWFQQKIRGENPEKKGRHTNHSLISSFLSYYCIKKRGGSDKEASIGFFSTARHHSKLPDIKNYASNNITYNDPSVENILSTLDNQIENINSNNKSFANSIIENITKGNGDWEEFSETFTERELHDNMMDSLCSLECKKDFYSDLLTVFSNLVFCDKVSAADIEEEHIDWSQSNEKHIERYISELEAPDSDIKKEMNKIREKGKKEVLSNIQGWDYNEKVGKIALPTGFGKTLTGLQAGLSVANEKSGVLVYCLPFTSIIDQTDSVLKDIYGFDIYGNEYTLHHHLSDTAVRNEKEYIDESDFLSREDYMVGESWRSGIVLTTFVQLFESLVSPSNSQSMKLPSLEDSVIILDEPQALSTGWWNIIVEVVSFLLEKYNSTVISMTATQPSIFDNSKVETKELLEKEYYFGFLSENPRVKYIMERSAKDYIQSPSEAEPIDYEKATKKLIERDGNVMAICNTISSCRRLHKEIRNQNQESVNLNKIYYSLLREKDSAPDKEDILDYMKNSENKRLIAHLSTRLPPIDRKNIIDIISSEILDSEYDILLTTTQLIEAGVDISFDSIYRDIAPITSIVQAAGRCNRSFEKASLGEVHIWRLDSPNNNNMTPSEAIYSLGENTNFLQITRKTLLNMDNKKEINEKRMNKDFVEEYYNILSEKSMEWNNLVKYMEEGNYKKLGEESLININKSREIVICRTKEEVEKLKQIFENEDWDNIDELKESQVSIPVYNNNEESVQQILESCHKVPKTENLYYIENTRDNPSFDDELGVVVPESSASSRILF